MSKSISSAFINTYGSEQLQYLKNLPYDQAKKAVLILLKQECPNFRCSWSALANITNAILKKIA